MHQRVEVGNLIVLDQVMQHTGELAHDVGTVGQVEQVDHQPASLPLGTPLADVRPGPGVFAAREHGVTQHLAGERAGLALERRQHVPPVDAARVFLGRVAVQPLALEHLDPAQPGFEVVAEQPDLQPVPD